MTTDTNLLRRVEDAATPADLFGPQDGSDQARRRARRTHRVIATALHPDRRDPAIDAARGDAAFAKATTFFEQWSNGIEAADEGTIIGANGTWTLGAQVGRGTVANLYAVPGGDAVVKIARRRSSSRYLRNERAALTRLREQSDSWLAPYLPRLLDTATLRSPGGGRGAEQREANVLGSLTRADGYVALTAVQAAAPDGLDGRDWAWMQRRIIRALAAVHAAGLVHGALLPENVLIHPEQHGVVLAGWSFATRPGRPAEGVVASQAAAYPPEVTGGVVTPATDVAMLGALGLAMLRPDQRVQRRFSAGLRQDAPGMRPRAADLQGEYDELLDRLYGPRRFRPLDLAV
ncbi:hypothetical protein QE364_000808 [Nocardioides zeae]|uniref:Uncharacterized protein n=1 Tax=Nocardioides zeae TaxID=1457234 RepID=A0ACC6IED5_9ACTN|nr:hypothetical protein [Nocardioides zeae]MDR6174311.1 hypothetical protein [Nocardioides zeae]MDR6209116.1 hypothetical protein [Nocardioides zeae]